MQPKKLLRSIGICIGSVLLAIVIGCILMTCAYVMPTYRMLPHVVQSEDTIDLEGSYYWWAPGYPISRLDGFTDNVMMQTAVFETTESPLKAAMLNQRMEFPKANLTHGVALLNYVNGARNGEVVSYGRYWHGYLIFLKPLLTLFTLPDIRVFNMILQWVLALALLFLAHRKGGYRMVIPLGVALLCLNPVSTALSMQYSSIYYLALIFSILQLQFDLYRKPKGWLLFLWLGIATAFFDFLTYPPAAWAICLCLGLFLMQGSAKDRLGYTVASGAAWCFGYAGMWSGKWVVGSLISGQNILLDATQSVQHRTGHQVDSIPGSENIYGYLDTVTRNLEAYLNIPALVLLLFLVLFVAFLILRKGYRFHPNTALLPSLLLVAIVPFAWYFVAKNHAWIHYWMTHRILSATGIALSGFISFSLKKPSAQTSNILSGETAHG